MIERQLYSLLSLLLSIVHFTGIDEWPTHFPDASGPRQSPVNLDSRQSVYDPSMCVEPLRFDYELSREIDICNNGHTVVVYLGGYRTGNYSILYTI